MLNAFTILLGFQLVGEVLARSARLPVPGPVIGMLLLFGVLLSRRAAHVELAQTANGLLRHLGLLFVPAAVGIVTHLELLATIWLPIALIVLVGTAATLAASGLALRLFPARSAPVVQEPHHD